MSPSHDLTTASELRGIDPASSMIAVAADNTDDPRLTFDAGGAEHLPCPDGHFDLVLATTSFDHWSDRSAGLQQCARALGAGGVLVIVDLISPSSYRRCSASDGTGRAPEAEPNAFLRAAGFTALAWHDLYTPLIKAVTTSHAARLDRYPI